MKTAGAVGWRQRVAFAPLLASLALVGCAEEVDERVEQGRQHYLTYCVLCHGNDGEGYVADAANALSNQDFLSTVDDAFLDRAITRGRPGTPMSGWGVERGGPLSPTDVEALRLYIRSWQSAPNVDLSQVEVGAGKPATGEALYAVECAECHGPEGESGDYMSINNAEFLVSASDAFLSHVIAKGRAFTNMKGYEQQLSPQQIDDLVALIRSWEKPVDESPIELPSKDLGDPVINPTGPEPGFGGSDIYVPVAEVWEAYEAESRMVLLDARAPGDYVEGHISGAVSVPFYEAADFADQLPADTWIVCYCACPHAESTAACKSLQASGFSKVKVIDEGLPAWIDAGYPITEGAKP